MYAPQRHEEIVAAARRAGRVEVNGLADQLNVTPETIRRDLAALERLGKIRRVHGGALPMAQTEPEPSLLDRLGLHSDAKERIAARAILELPPQGTVLLDSGTTTLAIARAMPPEVELEVVTNSVAIAAVLTDHPGLAVHMVGGAIRQRTGACVGHWATDALERLCIDVAFIGANGFSPSRGMTTPDEAEAAVKQAMVASSRRPIVVADSSKAYQERLHRFATIDDIALLITDDELDDEAAAELAAASMEVVRA
ncbi:DeoR/GlpR transcriptional regulator [Tessaracoccus antarcticus]|uniref:Lactose phosphotransferase system repressor n=1 Tax=Tessaracoccus antarcticus TaxID=2479848 RepID=A0A3M0GML7_9ACTN|nr:DeoR/GlpR transcriptional regulator [Tessaracoccus antarcticus]